MCHTMAKVGSQGKQGCPLKVMGCPHQAVGKRAEGVFPLGHPHSALGQQAAGRKTWDMGQWEHSPELWDMEQQRCHSPTNNRTRDSGDILTEPWDMEQQGCPH